MEGQSRHIPTPKKDKAEPSLSEHLITERGTQHNKLGCLSEEMLQYTGLMLQGETL